MRPLRVLLALFLLPACGDPTPARPDPRRDEIVRLLDDAAQSVGGSGARVDVVRGPERVACPDDKKVSRWRFEKFVHLPESEIDAAFDRVYHHWGQRGFPVERAPRRKVVRASNDTFAVVASPKRTPERTGYVLAAATVCPKPGAGSPTPSS